MPFSSTLPAFENHGGSLESFDDGHCPETFRFQEHGTKNGAMDDGLAHNENGMATPRIVRYNSVQAPALPSSDPVSPSSVHIYDGILDPNNARMLYQVTASSRQAKQTFGVSHDAGEKGESPWGTYVTIKEALEWIDWNERKGNAEQELPQNSNGNVDVDVKSEEYFVTWRQKVAQYYRWKSHRRQSLREEKDGQIGKNDENDSYFQKKLIDIDNIRHALAVEAVAKFFVGTVPYHQGTTVAAKAQLVQTSNETLFHTAQILKEAHGVAVWALSSSIGNSVSYHIDYAELLRYEFNVTVPPLWAGTVHCSDLWNDQKKTVENDDDEQHSQCNFHQQRMQGGEFCVNLRGLDHYQEHGYKGNLSGDPSGGWKRPSNSGAFLNGGVHINDNNQWVTIPYAFNRGIAHRGDLPHLSTPIESISKNDRGIDAAQEISRVIVGFNVFGHDVGARIAKAPEHSKLFRRKVRLYRSTLNASTIERESSNGKSCQKSGIDLSQIRKSKGLTKLLVLAKRERVKEELRRNQEQLSRKIWHQIINNHGQDDAALLRVSDIVEKFGRPNDSLDSVWPKANDVHVHLHHMLLETKRSQDATQQKAGHMLNLFQDIDGTAGPRGTWYHIVAKEKKDGGLSGLIPLSATLDVIECS